jgi:hypothetical protein
LFAVDTAPPRLVNFLGDTALLLALEFSTNPLSLSPTHLLNTCVVVVKLRTIPNQFVNISAVSSLTTA